MTTINLSHINLSQYQTPPFSCITRLYFVLYAVGTLHLSRGLYKSTLFMQNKANFPDSRIIVSPVLTKDYGNKRLGGGGENKANTKPIQSQFAECPK